MTEAELERFEIIIQDRAQKAREEGSLRTFTGDIEALVAGEGD